MATGVSRGLPRIVDVNHQMRNDDGRWRGMFMTVMVATLVIGLIAFGTAPDPYPLALLVMVISCLAAVLRPVIGVYLIMFLGLIGDTVTTPWWPFLKNMSSKESILYVNDKLFLSPLEVLATVTIIAWLLQRLVDPGWHFVRGRLFWPIMVFTVFVLFGIAHGKLTGGDTRVAIFEFRPLLYIPVIYVLVTNLFSSRRQYRRLMLLAFVAVAIQSIFALVYYSGLTGEEKNTIESLTEHSATVHMDALFIFAICAWLFKCRGWVRWLTLLLSVPTAWAYILSQRRAAMVAFFAGIIVVFVALYFRRKRAFWFLAPTLAILLLGLVLATWNASGPIALPAQAVKTVLFPNDLAQTDRGSDEYRVTENFDLWYTIRASPVTGLGFGKEFYRPVPLPDISFFEFYQYMSHNSVLWIWVKVGFFGFAAMLFMFARSIQMGARSMLGARNAEQAAVVVTGISYVVMFIVFAYVDIIWLLGRTTIFLAFCFAVCADFVLTSDETERSVDNIHTRQLESLTQ